MWHDTEGYKMEENTKYLTWQNVLIILNPQKYGLMKVGGSHISGITLYNNCKFPLSGN